MKIENTLIESARNGDRESFTEIYEKLVPTLYRYALYTLGNKDDAEDVVSETFLEAWHGISKLREAGAFQTWIYRILSARCKRKIKEYVKGRNTYDIDQFSETKAYPDDMISDGDIGNKIDRMDLLHALAELSPSERQIVCLSVLDGYTTKEISKIMVSPHGTVSSKLYRALKKMRKILE